MKTSKLFSTIVALLFNGNYGYGGKYWFCKNCKIKSMFKIYIALISTLFFISCSEKHSSNKEIFERYFDKNVEMSTKILLQNNDMDSLEAVEYSKCMLYKLYEIDSTFVQLPTDSMHEFIRKNMPLIRKECGPLPSDNY